MVRLTVVLITLMASPAFAASGPFISLRNTNFVVMIAFAIFIGIILYLGVPKMLGGLLDKRAAAIKAELDEAKSLREEAKALLASYEKKQTEVQAQAERILEAAKAEAAAAAEQAKADIVSSVARRLAAAEDQIASAKASAVKEVRDQAIVVAIGAARDIISKQMTEAESNSLIDASIDDVGSKLH
ncbi:MAG: F0F1 ATP synthase subunit B [Planktomarina sp.]|mgnify:FL=1|jgi:F-type H+-transporting ATPase subunit b|nr:F0F1 ATP synthase subunit B [Planktomarina sp.]MDS9945990.1 F0F1 ATP synthase subunit B [Planktomarina sp.]MDS9950891.1 F0F1 ATP synthase subunit B [Planktomarina sp.]